MGQWYNLTEATPFREPWSTQHGSFQTFFCKIEGVEESIQINKKAGNTPKLGAIYGSLEKKPGKDYLKFNSESAPEGEAIPQFNTPQATVAPAVQPKEQFDMPAWFIPYGNMIERLYDQLPKDDKAVDLKDVGKEVTDEERAEVEDLFNNSTEVK